LIPADGKRPRIPPHGALVGEDVAEQVAAQQHVELVGFLTSHGVVDIQVKSLNVVELTVIAVTMSRQNTLVASTLALSTEVSLSCRPRASVKAARAMRSISRRR
jgi:hypothetical protein